MHSIFFFFSRVFRNVAQHDTDSNAKLVRFHASLCEFVKNNFANRAISVSRRYLPLSLPKFFSAIFAIVFEKYS